MIKREHLTDAVICRENDSVIEVSRILRDTQRRHVIVLNKGDSPVGVISTVDINNRVVSEDKDPKSFQAKEIMTKGIKFISVNDTYQKGFEIMAQMGTYSIPVVLEDGKLIGLLEFARAFKLKELRDAKAAQGQASPKGQNANAHQGSVQR